VAPGWSEQKQRIELRRRVTQGRRARRRRREEERKRGKAAAPVARSAAATAARRRGKPAAPVASRPWSAAAAAGRRGKSKPLIPRRRNNSLCYSSNPRRWWYIVSYTWASIWAIHRSYWPHSHIHTYTLTIFMANCCAAVAKNLTTISPIQTTNIQDLDTISYHIFDLFLVCTFCLYI
jgi:hypothetical protein